MASLHHRPSLSGFCLIVFFLTFSQIHAFITGISVTKSIKHCSKLHAIEINLLDELTDHDAEGARLSLSIAGWLDQEWMPQEVHARMGESAKQTYIKCREAGENEIMPIMVNVAEDLEKNWGEFDKDAFVNCWDIGNYVADYLNDRVGEEGCGCSADIFVPDEN